MVPLRRSNQEITDKKEIEDLFNKAMVCRIGMTSPEGPYVVPLHFAYSMETLYFHCALKGRKNSILKQDPRVCVEIEFFEGIKTAPEPCNYSTYYSSIIASGRAEPIKDSAEKNRALSIITEKYSGRAADFSSEQLAGLEVFKVNLFDICLKKSKN